MVDIGDIQFAVSRQVVIAWWGSHEPPKSHILGSKGQEIDSIVQCTGSDSGLMKALLTSTRPKCVLDVHSVSGECMYHIFTFNAAIQLTCKIYQGIALVQLTSYT